MKTVFVNGCFDVLHIGHIRLFKYAKTLGDYLIVALDSDIKIQKSKGSDRPFNSLNDRIEMLSALKFVNEIRVFSSNEQLEELVKTISPDFMVVGSDWEGKNVIGSSHAKELKFFRRIDGYSTTKILQSSVNR